MRKLVVFSLAFLLVFSSIISVSAETLPNAYYFNGVILSTEFEENSSNTGGKYNIYQKYLADNEQYRPTYYLIAKATTPDIENSGGYVLYTFTSTNDNVLQPLYYSDSFVYTNTRVDINAYAYISESWVDGVGAWRWFASDTYSANSMIGSYATILWSSDDILLTNGQVGLAGDVNWINKSANLPESGDGLENQKTLLEKIVAGILNLPELLIKGLVGSFEDILIPDADYIEKKFDTFTTDLKNKFNIDMTVFETMFDDEKAVEDTNMNYHIPGVGTLNLKVFDATYLQQGVNFFRPIIRGFLVLLLVFYNVRQLIGFFGFDAGVVAGRSDSIAESKKEQRGKE